MSHEFEISLFVNRESAISVVVNRESAIFVIVNCEFGCGHDHERRSDFESCNRKKCGMKSQKMWLDLVIGGPLELHIVILNIL